MTETVTSLQTSAAAADKIIKGAESVLNETYNATQDRLSEVEEKSADLYGQLYRLNAKLEALKEGVGTLSVNILWDKRAKTSAAYFWGSGAILVLMLLILPGFALYHLDDVVKFFRHLTDELTRNLGHSANGAQGIGNPTSQAAGAVQNDLNTLSEISLATIALSRLVLITLPIVFYFWMVRLVVRFNSRSLLLLDDAQQRHTMMDTYFHLIERETASKEDRALILAALFRPTPGQGPDNVDPPNFTELLQKGMAK